MTPADDARVVAWIDALIDRHTRDFTRPQLLKAIRALSARYVERRADLASRSPIDSQGKRGAFAAFYAPLHLLTARAVARSLSLDGLPLDLIRDLGCGTGAASAGWSLALSAAPRIEGVDRDIWAVREAGWTWSQLGCSGRARRGDVEASLDEAVAPGAQSSRLAPGSRASERTAVVLGWTVNELDAACRGRVLEAIATLGSGGTSILVLEPIARAAAPWWQSWVDRLAPLGARADTWKFDLALPARLADLDEAAGFRREALAARSLWVRGKNIPV